ncbi:MAG: hypothetical protein GKR97_15145 [Rhizobiaceae bacterium]|nr:hypothetical protein [Rhizobiaceae bacterium]
MRFLNRGQAKKHGDDLYVHQPGPPSPEVPGFLVALQAGGLPFIEDWYPEEPPEPEFEDDFDVEPELM